MYGFFAADLVKVYNNSLRALDNLEITVPRGSVTALLGPNGSGKTTLMKILAGIITDFQGTAQLLGEDLPTRDIAQYIGYMPQNSALYPNLSVMENLSFFGSIQSGQSHRELVPRIRELAAILALSEKLKEPVSRLSGGMKQRVSLGCALIHNPMFLILDEPTVGLDPSLRFQFWEYFREITSRNGTVFLSTHAFDEVKYCTHLILMKEGRILLSGEKNAIIQQEGTGDIEEIYLRYVKKHEIN